MEMKTCSTFGTLNTLNIGGIIAIAISVLALFVVIGFFVYNHRAGMQVKALESIDSKLADGSVVTKIEVPGSKEDEKNQLRDVSETLAEIATNSESKIEDIADMPYNIGKSGKEYTKDEIEALIKD